MSKLEYVLWIVFVLWALLLLLVICFCNSIFLNKVSFEINPFDFISVIITVLLAVFVTRKLNKKNHIESELKGMFTKDFNLFREDFKLKILSMLEKKTNQLSETNQIFKSLRMNLNSLIKLSCVHNFLEKNSANVVALNDKVTEIWELFTDSPKTVPVKKQTEEEVLMFKKNVEQRLLEVNELIFTLIIEINQK